jgi:hypothetical protein
MVARKTGGQMKDHPEITTFGVDEIFDIFNPRFLDRMDPNNRPEKNAACVVLNPSGSISSMMTPHARSVADLDEHEVLCLALGFYAAEHKQRIIDWFLKNRALQLSRREPGTLEIEH